MNYFLRKVLSWPLLMLLFIVLYFIYLIALIPFVLFVVLVSIPYYWMSENGTEVGSIYMYGILVGIVSALNWRKLLSIWCWWFEKTIEPLHERLESFMEIISEWGGWNEF